MVSDGRHVTFELCPLPPFRLDLTVWALRRRGHNRIDSWDGVYRRALLIDGHTIVVEVVQQGSPATPILTVTATSATDLPPHTVSSTRRLVEVVLGIDVDLTPFYELAAVDPRLSVLRDRFLGVRPPRFPSVFEALVNAVANQQLSLEVGIELLNRLADTYGTRQRAEHVESTTFPEAAVVASASVIDLRTLGFSFSKSRSLVAVAEAVSSGRLTLDALQGMSSADATRDLEQLHGIGRWSAEYVLLRGLGRLDVFPAGDVGARNKLQRMLGLASPPRRVEIMAILAPWQPFAGVVYFHLLLDGLVARGELTL